MGPPSGAGRYRRKHLQQCSVHSLRIQSVLWKQDPRLSNEQTLPCTGAAPHSLSRRCWHLSEVVESKKSKVNYKLSHECLSTQVFLREGSTFLKVAPSEAQCGSSLSIISHAPGPPTGPGAGASQPGIWRGRGPRGLSMTSPQPLRRHFSSLGRRGGEQSAWVPQVVLVGNFIPPFKILLNLHDVQWLNTVRKCRWQFHEGSVPLLCTNPKDASISQS